MSKEIENKEILDFLTENIDNEKYEKIWGRDGVKDIVVKKQLTFDKMSPKQEAYVKSVYSGMRGIENKSSKVASDIIEDNRKYQLSEKPDVIMKIQRLQNEVSDKTPQITNNIIETVMKYRTISEKQLKHINEAYISLVIEGNDTVKVVTNDSKVLDANGNNKYTLDDRPDIKEKITKIMGSDLYYTLPDRQYKIISSVHKYKSVSDKQLFYIEEAYNNIFK